MPLLQVSIRFNICLGLNVGFCGRKNFYFCAPPKKITLASSKKIMFLRPAKKICRPATKIFAFRRKICVPPQNFALRPQNLRRNAKFCFAPQNLRAKTRKTAQTGLRITPQKCGIARKKKFCAANCAICAEAKIPENGNPIYTGTSRKCKKFATFDSLT